MIEKKIGELKLSKIGNLIFIESKLEIGEERSVPLIANTKAYAIENFNKDSIYIYDSPPGTSCPVIEAVKDTDLVILVTEPTPFGFHDFKIAIETLELLNNKFVVVLNKYGIGNNDVEDYCKKRSIPIIAKIEADKDIAEKYSSGKLIYPTNEKFKIEINKIAEYIKKLN
jgi:MinD superfamily P-loop ATPase